MKVLIVDDEPLARLRLRTLVESLTELGAEVAGEAGHADEAESALRGGPIDAVLLDIAMPGRDGLRLAAALNRLAPRPAVIFVTAHAEHALRAFELEALDYLTKPVRRERLLAALQRVQPRRGRDPAADAPVLLVVDRGRMLRLPVDEVLYLKAQQKYVTLRTASHSYLVDESLAELEPRLGDAFIRIHRNALVARRAVRALALRDLGDEESGGSWAVRVAPLDEWLAVSRRQVGTVRALLGEPAAGA